MEITVKKDDKQQPADTDLQLQKSTESHRYILAMSFVLSFMAIMFLAVLGTIFWGYTGISTLVGFFSAWVATIIGFYFLQQNTAGAQNQAKVATESAATQTARANQEADKKAQIAKEAISNIDDSEKANNELLALLTALKEKTGKQLKPEDVQKLQAQVESLKQTKGTGKQLIPEDVHEFHAQVESLSREAQERLKKARETITRLST
jgi:hypothetical protein